MSNIGILHPGEMGVSVAASALSSGHTVYWVTEGRSVQTRIRAQEHGLTPADSIADLCRNCEIILSICPPHAAQDVAQSVVAAGFRGLYLDANAISPQRASLIGQLMEAVNIRFVDGGIIGGPAWKPNETWLYLSGDEADRIASCFINGPLETKIISNEIGKASALKMCYAAYSKGTTALLAAILATADALGVRESLYEQWDRDDAGFSNQVNQRITRVTTKAWRFEGEMKEIAVTLREAGLPGEFHDAAAEMYQRMTNFLNKNEPTLSLEQLLAALLVKQT